VKTGLWAVDCEQTPKTMPAVSAASGCDTDNRPIDAIFAETRKSWIAEFPAWNRDVNFRQRERTAFSRRSESPIARGGPRAPSCGG